MGKRVLCCGTFDDLHPGHVSFLQQASRLGDELVVVVARDENVGRIKGRPPAQDEETRRLAVGKVPEVSRARLGNRGADLLRVVAEVAPDIIALGYDQKAPPGLAEAFPQCALQTLDAYHPDRYKSSLMRKTREP
ncbi:adenylyltransferase/cytidyltransferase family protein [Candidatus Latescibacterota bacterium]